MPSPPALCRGDGGMQSSQSFKVKLPLDAWDVSRRVQEARRSFQRWSTAGPWNIPVCLQIKPPPLASQVGYYSIIYHMELRGLNEIIGTKHLAWCLARERAWKILAVITIICLGTANVQFCLGFFRSAVLWCITSSVIKFLDLGPRWKRSP